MDRSSQRLAAASTYGFVHAPRPRRRRRCAHASRSPPRDRPGWRCRPTRYILPRKSAFENVSPYPLSASLQVSGSKLPSSLGMSRAKATTSIPGSRFERSRCSMRTSGHTPSANRCLTTRSMNFVCWRAQASSCGPGVRYASAGTISLYEAPARCRPGAPSSRVLAQYRFSRISNSRRHGKASPLVVQGCSAERLAPWSERLRRNSRFAGLLSTCG